MPSEWLRRLRLMPFNTFTQISLPSKPENLSIVLRRVSLTERLLHAAWTSLETSFECSFERWRGSGRKNVFSASIIHTLCIHSCALHQRFSILQLCLIRNNKRNFLRRSIFFSLVLMKNSGKDSNSTKTETHSTKGPDHEPAPQFVSAVWRLLWGGGVWKLSHFRFDFWF